jgi:hypothetical protein
MLASIVHCDSYGTLLQASADNSVNVEFNYGTSSDHGVVGDIFH